MICICTLFVAFSRTNIETASAREEEKTKTIENRMQEKRKGLKTTSNECIVFVSETHKVMIFRNVLCILLALPSLKGASALRKFPNCFLTKMRHTLHSSCKETISAMPQEAELSQTSSRIMTENDESDSSSSTSDEEELGNDDEEEQEQRDIAQH